MPVFQRGQALSAVPSVRSFVINPLALSPRHLECGSNFPCPDEDCKGIVGAFLLQINSLQPGNQDSFPMQDRVL